MPPPLRAATRTAASGRSLETTTLGREEFFPARFWPAETEAGHLRFALKHQWVDLSILRAYFDAAGSAAIAQMLTDQPTSVPARRLWFFYEWMTGRTIDCPDQQQGNYVDALDPTTHYTAPAQHSPRHRVRDNLLGNPAFCPLVWRTESIETILGRQLDQTCRQLMQDYPGGLISRANAYLYTKETKSSFAIEDELPTADRIERFVMALRRASTENFCEKSKLIALQKIILDPRFAASDWRTNQDYVGQSVGWTEEKVHHVCPRPEDLAELMAGWEQCHHRLARAGNAISAIITTASLSYGFVFLHPLADGNGRTHRLLIHNLLALAGFVPPEMIIPVSATMLDSPERYDRSLESTNCPLMDCIDYELDTTGKMSVKGQTIDLYRYPNFTFATEALAHFIELAVEKTLRGQILFLQRYDAAAAAIRDIVDLPDRSLANMVRFTLQNGGRLSQNKRQRYFDVLTDDEVRGIETAVAGVIDRFGADGL